MSSDILGPASSLVQALVVVRSEPDGEFTAQVVNLPEVRATSPNKELAIAQVRAQLAEWVTQGRLVVVDIPQENPLMKWAGWALNDPLYDDYLEELERARREDREQAIREYEAQCAATSSTPTT